MPSVSMHRTMPKHTGTDDMASHFVARALYNARRTLHAYCMCP